MRFICKDDLSLIISLPKNNEIIIGDLKYDSEVINLEKRVANLYMESISFIPYIKNDRYYHYKSEIRQNGIFVSHYSTHGNCSSVGNQIDVSDYEFAKIDNLLNGFTFIINEYLEDKVFINKYKIVKKEEDLFEINKIDCMSLYFNNKNLTISKNNVEIKLEETELFFENIDYGFNGIYNSTIKLIFNSFVNEKGFYDIYKEFKRFLHEIPSFNYYKLFSYYYYIGQLDFYYLAEYLIKNNMTEKLYTVNPVITNKPIQKKEDIPVLSKVAMEIKTKYRFDEDDMEILFAMEGHKNIGKEGLKVIYEYILAIDNIKNSWNTPFSTWRKDMLFDAIYNILDTFEITPKNLMNRFARAMFYENISISQYANIINDTIEMANTLNIELDKKLPKDIFKIHDLLKDQIRYIENKAIEKQFNNEMNINNSLLNLLPTSDEFTIISPKNPNDLINEGIKLNHCVGSYVDRYVSGYSKIFFIRKKVNEETPFVTLELNRKNQLAQISGYSNKKPSNDVLDYVNKWLENLNN